MKRKDPFIRELITLASGSASLGILFSFITVSVCHYLSVDIFKHLWVLGIPSILAIGLNILFIELYNKYRKKGKWEQ